MIQLYFLSILCNGLSGYIFFSDGNSEAGESGESIDKSMKLSIKNPMFILILGILSVVTGVLKLLLPFENKFPFFGDLAPAVAGVTAGLLLIFGINRQDTSSVSSERTPGSLGENLPRIRKPLGLGLLACAILHFLFPQALFL
jgi:hypothetical protein